MKKKILSLVLALLMAIPSAAFVAADETTDEAAPVAASETEASEAEATAAVEAEEEETSPYAYAVEFLANYGIFKGYSADNPGIEDPIQRYQMALFVGRISTGWVDDEKWEDGSQNTSTFKDVDSEPVCNYLGAISYANQKGIIEGYTPNTFDPYRGIRYQDALTMVCRALGYTGLPKYPWDYIETAESLGLTKGIEKDVAYTDDLTRGQVAQIIYNALFTPTKSGTTLALANFGIEFAWETIVITAADRDVYESGAKTTTEDYQAENTFVAFKLYNEDGTVDPKGPVFYAVASELGLDASKNEDDLAVGRTYVVLFEKDANSNYVDIVDYYNTPSTEVWNSGITDDEGNAQDYAIQETLAGYTLVTKYSPANYLGVIKKLKPEIIVYNALTQIKVVTGYTSKLAIDYTTGDILVECDKADASVTTNDGKYYRVAWYYNATLNRYYELRVSDKNGKPAVYINWMSDEEFEKTYKDALTEVLGNTTGFSTAIGVPSATAYASLVLEDVDLDGTADRGIYEEYRLGYLRDDTIRCHNVDWPSYAIDEVSHLDPDWRGTWRNPILNVFRDPNNYCKLDHSYKEVAWFAEGFAPSRNENDEYPGGFVIYSYDPDTNEIKIVKEIGSYENPLGTDADSFVGHGVLNGYSVTKNTVIIDGTSYAVDYNTLKGTGFYKVSDTSNADAYAMSVAYATALDSMYEQFVEYAVVDGKVVAMYLMGTLKDEYFIVKEFAGITNDGYIAVDAYSTSTGALSTYCIASYNGWKQGDYYYWLTDDKVRDAFTPGSLYFIKSRDEEEDAYYVEIAGEYTNGKYILDDLYAGTLELTPTTITSYPDDYLIINGTTHQRKSTSDKFIILTDDVATNSKKWTAPIYVYEGKLPDGWTITGDRIGDKNNSHHLYVFVNVNPTTITNTFAQSDAYGHGMWLYEGGRVLESAYDSASMLNADLGRYILGASTVTVELLNLYTGARDAKIVDKNIDLKSGHVYVSVGGRIVEEGMLSGNDELPVGVENVKYFITLMANEYYPLQESHKFGYFDWTVSQNFNAAYLNDVLGEEGTYKSVQVNDEKAPYDYDRNDRVNGNNIKVYGVHFDTDKAGVGTMTVESFDAAAYRKAHPEVTAIAAAYVYIPGESRITVYIDLDAAKTTNTTAEKTTTIPVATDINGETGVDVEATVTYTYKTVKGDVTEATITGITFEIVHAENYNHNDIAERGLAFGHKGDHLLGTYHDNDLNGLYDFSSAAGMWSATPWFDLVTDAQSEDVTYTTYASDCCDLVKAISFTGLDIDILATPTAAADDKAAITLVLNLGDGSSPVENYSLDVTCGVLASITSAGVTFVPSVTLPAQFAVAGHYHAIDTTVVEGEAN